jgi:hypothetical protein
LSFVLLSFLAGGLFRTLTASLWPRTPRFGWIPAGARKDGGKRMCQEELAGAPGHVPLQPHNEQFRYAYAFEKFQTALIDPLLRDEFIYRCHNYYFRFLCSPERFMRRVSINGRSVTIERGVQAENH